MKDKTTAAILALVLGGLGAHKFYLGQTGMGILYLLFCWTFIPAIVAFIEFFVLLMMSQESFNARYNGRFALEAGPAVQNAISQPQNIVVNVQNSASAGQKDVTEQLKHLHELKVSGILTDEEFVAEKRRLLARG